uniref:Uncharacterized protein n=1 Tax=Anguilla anguilla TaxID=7936 RepID=A0A0E9VZP1_ANGAN
MYCTYLSSDMLCTIRLYFVFFFFPPNLACCA